MKYAVEFKAEITGRAYIEAKNSKEARRKVRESLEPSYDSILNEDLVSLEKYDIKPKQWKNN